MRKIRRLGMDEDGEIIRRMSVSAAKKYEDYLAKEKEAEEENEEDEENGKRGR